MGYNQKGRVEVQRLNFKCEINLYRLTLGCNAAKKKPNRTKLNQLNQITTNIYTKYMYILLTRISNVTFNPQLVLFDRLPFRLYICLTKSSINARVYKYNTIQHI